MLAPRRVQLNLGLMPPHGGCHPLEWLEGFRCFGLTWDAGASNMAECHKLCCADSLCEIWQFHPEEGCARGRPHICLHAPTSRWMPPGVMPARLREQSDVGPDTAWLGSSAITWWWSPGVFTSHERVEPYIDVPEVRRFHGGGDEAFLARRWGPDASQFEVSMSCWSPARRPDQCCLPGHGRKRDRGGLGCWWYRSYEEHCCKVGAESVEVLTDNVLYEAFHQLSNDLPREAFSDLHFVLPGIAIDEDAFSRKRLRWRVGWNEPTSLCSSVGREGGGVMDDVNIGLALWPLVRLLKAAGDPLTRTFVNIGAGTCRPPDPLHQFLHSPDAAGFVGLAVDADWSRLRQCPGAMSNATAKVIPVHLALDPLTAVAALRPHMDKLLRRRRPRLAGNGSRYQLDILVMDIDACDCLVVEELLQMLAPRILVLEIASHIPPPFRFSAQHDVLRSSEWLDVYNIDRLDPVAGCSLSFALHRFRPYGMHLLQLLGADAIFVHESLAPTLADALGVLLPQDEFLCYRRSRPFVQMPLGHVREWFFAPHPAESIGFIIGNLTFAARTLGRPDAPFTVDY